SAALLAALQLMRNDSSRHAHLQQLIRLLKTRLKLDRWRLMPSDTAIQPLLVGSNEEAVRVSEWLLTKGLLVPAIRPPTVPTGTARLRISLSAAHSEAEILRLVEALHEAEQALLA
ncbi:MAG TPA: aminotransferase class I/II-fold pyridoxal phosphate-dependent enzyme, partial [Methylophilaceae bacterium]|nr:aminotransferase class I/II-fold pyridoxal phosphate-dependent enzyme [Methylophilaceae bacterium]